MRLLPLTPTLLQPAACMDIECKLDHAMQPLHMEFSLAAQVRMSPDNMKAFVLWRAYPDCEAAARVELNRK